MNELKVMKEFAHRMYYKRDNYYQLLIDDSTKVFLTDGRNGWVIPRNRCVLDLDKIPFIEFDWKKLLEKSTKCELLNVYQTEPQDGKLCRCVQNKDTFIYLMDAKLKYFNLDYAVVYGNTERSPVFIHERETILSGFIMPTRMTLREENDSNEEV